MNCMMLANFCLYYIRSYLLESSPFCVRIRTPMLLSITGRLSYPFPVVTALF